MAMIMPFRALRPRPEFTAQVAAPPYDVVSLDEARKIANGNPYCFLRIGRAELELPDGVDPYSPEVYERGAANLRGFIESAVMVQESRPMFGVYRQRWGNHEQTGLVALASVDEYDRGIIKKHELTRLVKENDRVRIIETHESQSGPVLLFFRRPGTFKDWLESVTAIEPDSKFTANDGIEHTVWSVRNESDVHRLLEDFRAIEAMYIADGHHRSAAASRVRAARGQSKTGRTLNHEDGFLAVIFPHDELQILPYNRVVRDLHGRTPGQFLEALMPQYDVTPISQPGEAPPAGFDMYVDGQWYRAQPKLTREHQDEMQKDPVRALAVSVLSERVLEPILGIADQRSDTRIDFVGGVRGWNELEAMVDRGDWAVAFWLYPTTVDELMAVSDAERIMPPKSTWFEPKLRDGLFVHLLRDEER